MMQRSLAGALQPKLPRVVFVLCVIQPLMDVLSFWLDRAGAANTITLLLRLGVLILIAATGLILSRRKWIYGVMAAVLVVIAAAHVAVCSVYGYQRPLYDLTNLVRIYQLPLVTLAFITYFKRNERCLDALKAGFLAALGVIVLVEVLATLTGTDPHTYANKGIGVLGWFLTTSAQSAIVSMVIPVAAVCVLERKKLHPGYAALIGAVGFAVLFLFATRLTYAALLGCMLCLAGSCLVLKRMKQVPAGRAAAVFAALGLAAVLLYGLSPMHENNLRVAENAALKEQDIVALVEQDRAEAEAAGLTGRELETASLKSAYEKYLPGVTGRFGLERTAEFYSYSYHINDLSNTRLQRQSYCLMLLQDQPLGTVAGLELADLTQDGLTYDAENDFHGIYFLCGLVGLIPMILFLGYFLVRIAVALVRDFRRYFTLEAAGFGIALICGLVHAYFTAGVLRRPNANFYLAAILAAVYLLTNRDKENGL